MAIIPSAASPQAALRATVTESIEDPVSAERMIKAVTVVPCGHIFNEDTVIQCLARNKLCPLDRTPIERYIPNYNIRRLAETADVDSKEDEGPTEEAKAHFSKGKELSEKGDYEAAITVFLEALQLSPNYEKAQAYLDFCLQRSSQPLSNKPLPMNLPSSVKVESPKMEKASPGGISKERYTDLLLNLLEEPQIKSNSNLCKILGEQVEELMNQETVGITFQQIETYKWVEKLFVDNKVRQFVADKLQKIHAKNSPQSKRLLPHSPVPAAAVEAPSILSSSLMAPSSPAKASNLPLSISPQMVAKPAPQVVLPFDVKSPALPSIAFGKEMWEKYLGDIGAEPPLPPNINNILKSSCPFWPDNKVEDTHVLVLVPQTVNGKPLNLKNLGELVQRPRQREATKYEYLHLGQYTDPPAPPAHWVLMTNDVLPNSRNKSYVDQKALVNSYRQKAPYEVPSVLDAAVCIFMEYFRSGNYLYGQKPWTFTRCQEKYDADWQWAVGGFAPGGLRVNRYDDDVNGVAALRKFPSILSSSLMAPSLPAKASNLPLSISPQALAKPAPQVALPLEVKPSALLSIAFGKEMWKKYLGDIGAEPPLPPDINAILKGPCPIWSDKKIEETHVLVLIPQAINGKPLNLKNLGELVQYPRQREATQYAYLDLGQYTDPPAPPAHWVLMTKDVLPGSRSKSYAEQQALVHSYRQKAPYEIPSVLDATVCIFMEYFRSGNYLYGEKPWTFTRCQEKYNANWQLVVGGFVPGGLSVHNFYYYDCDHCGVGGLRKFPAIGP